MLLEDALGVRGTWLGSSNQQTKPNKMSWRMWAGSRDQGWVHKEGKASRALGGGGGHGAGGPCFSSPASLPVILFTSFLFWFWVQTEAQSSFSVLFPPTSYSQGLHHGLTTCSAKWCSNLSLLPWVPKSPHLSPTGRVHHLLVISVFRP